MTALSIQPTYPIFTDIDGQPLEAGYIWIGTANLNPITNPISVYWDAALTLPAAQPIRTVGGYPVNAGTPARLYVNSDYSIQVQNRNGSVVYSAPAATERYGNLITFADITGTLGSDRVTFLQAGTGAVTRTAQSKMREVVSVKDFGAVGDGVTDDTAAIQAAIEANKVNGSVHIPDGVFIIDPFVVTGATSFELFGPGTIKVAAGNVCHAIRFTNAVDVTLDGLTVDGNGANTTNNSLSGRGMIDFDGTSTRVTVRDCYFNAARGNSVRYNSVTKFMHVACRHEDFSADAVLVRNASTDFIVSDNTLISSNANLTAAAHSINVEATSPAVASRGLIANNNINVECAGIQLTLNVYDTTVIGNTIKANAAANGIKLDQTRTGIAVSNNTVYAGSLYGVFDAATDPATISENTIFSQVTYGIRSSVAGVVIKGNKVYGCNRGINASANNHEIIDNLVVDASARGISAGDGSLISGAVVKGNFVSNTPVGIYFRSTNGVCSGNTITGTSSQAIYLINSTGATFGPNTFFNNSINGYDSNDFGGVINNTFLDAIPTLNNIDTKKNRSDVIVTETAANIASIAATINTDQKFTGRLIWDSTNNRMMRAAGSAANSVWWVVDGSASVTPV